MNHKLNSAARLILFSLIVPGASAFNQTITLTLQKTIESPRVYIPGEEDKAGYWRDYGNAKAFDFYPETGRLAALVQESNGPARLFIFNLTTGEKMNEIIISPNTNNRSSTGALKFSPDGRMIAISTGDEMEFTLWNAESGTLIARQVTEDKTTNLDWNPAGEKLAVVTGKNIDIWNVNPLEKSGTVHGGRTATEWPFVANWSPDGSYMAIGTNTPALYIEKKGTQSAALQPETKGSTYMAEWNSTGRLLASAGSGGTGNIAIWRNPKNAVDSVFEKKYDLINTIESTRDTWWNKLAWDPSGRIIVAGDNKSNLCFWNATNGKLIKQINPNPSANITEVHWRKNYLVTLGSYPEKNFKIWQTDIHE